MTNEWFYAQGGQQIGPVSADALRQLAAEGQLQPSDLVWKNGMESWVPASRIKGLNLAPPIAPPVPPPTAENLSSSGTTAATWEPPVIRTMPFDTEQAAVAARQFGHQAKDVAVAAGADAVTAFKALASNPVGGLKVAFDGLGPSRAMIVGIVFAIIFDLCILIGVRSLFLGFFSPPDDMPAALRDSAAPSLPFGTFVKILLVGLVPLASIAAGSAAVRTVFRGKGSIQSDIFIAGASLLPFGVAVLLMGIVGLANIDVISLLGIFAITTTILMMYSGCTTLQGIPDAAATLSVPLMIVAAAYVCKVILASVLGP